MLYPEFPDALAGMTESEAICGIRMREVGRIEIHSQLIQLRPVDPALEMLWLDRITINKPAAVVEIACMQILLGSDRNKPY